MALLKFGNFSRNFSEFLGYLEWLGLNHKFFLEIEGPTIIFFQMRRDHSEIYKKLRGLNAKWQGIMDFQDLFSNRKFGGPCPRRVDQVARIGSTVDRGGTDKRVWQRLAGARRASASAHR
jgi:hypothetical protein